MANHVICVRYVVASSCGMLCVCVCLWCENNNFEGKVAEWFKATDCKSAGFRHHRFESCLSQNFLQKTLCSSKKHSFSKANKTFTWLDNIIGNVLDCKSCNDGSSPSLTLYAKKCLKKSIHGEYNLIG